MIEEDFMTKEEFDAMRETYTSPYEAIRGRLDSWEKSTLETHRVITEGLAEFGVQIDSIIKGVGDGRTEQTS